MKYLLLLLTFSCFGYHKDKTYKLTILHTNDHHGHFWKNKYGEYGMAARAALIKKIRKEIKQQGGHLLLLSGGDINTGSPYSDLQDAKPDFLAMKKLGYTAMALGNHEFDKPLSVLNQQMKWAKFPFLGANIFYKDNNQRAFQTHITRNLDDLKIAIVGFTTEDTNYASHEENAKVIEVRSPVESARELIPQLDQDHDLVIAVTHMGHYKKGHGTKAPGDITLAKSVKGIDFIIGGHSQIPLFQPDKVNDTYILQAYEWGKYVGRLDLEFLNGEYQVKNYKLIPINLKTKQGKKRFKQELAKLEGCGKFSRNDQCPDLEKDYIAEQKILENKKYFRFLKRYMNKIKGKLTEPVGMVKGFFLGRPGSRKLTTEIRETNLGRAIAQSMVERTHADFGMMNNGGVRIDIEPGSITYETILSLLPFANTLVTVELSPAEIKSVLENKMNKSVMHFYGISFKARKKNKRYQIREILIGTKKLNLKDKKSKYKLVTNSYVARGSLKQHPSYVDSGFIDALSFKEFVQSRGILNSSDFQTTSWSIK